MDKLYEEVPVVLTIPKDAVKVDITVTVFEDDELTKVAKHLSLGDIRDLREDFKEYIGDDWNALYVLTEEARKDIEKGHL